MSSSEMHLCRISEKVYFAAAHTPTAMPRYVILQHLLPSHSGRESHYDLMLERDGVLVTWALAEFPRAGLQTTATKLPDHRLAYLEYQGPVSRDRGEVRRVDAGEHQCSVMDGKQARVLLSGPAGTIYAELQHLSDDQWSARFSAAD